MKPAIEEQVETYERSASRISRANEVDPSEAQALASIGLSLVEMIHRVSEQWARSPRYQDEQRRIEDAETFARAYRKLDGGLAMLESAPIDQTDIKRARAELRQILSISMDDVVQAEKDLAAGKFRALGDVMNELRSRHRA
jgi:hypothetical protein